MTKALSVAVHIAGAKLEPDVMYVFDEKFEIAFKFSASGDASCRGSANRITFGIKESL